MHCILFIIAHNGRKCNKKTDPQRRESVFQFIKTVSQNTLEGVYADDRRIFYSNHMAKIAEQLSNFQPSVCWYFWLFFRQNHIENAVFVIRGTGDRIFTGKDHRWKNIQTAIVRMYIVVKERYLIIDPVHEKRKYGR